MLSSSFSELSIPLSWRLYFSDLLSPSQISGLIRDMSPARATSDRGMGAFLILQIRSFTPFTHTNMTAATATTTAGSLSPRDSSNMAAPSRDFSKMAASTEGQPSIQHGGSHWIAKHPNSAPQWQHS